jgi:hypothetical protein
LEKLGDKLLYWKQKHHTESITLAVEVVAELQPVVTAVKTKKFKNRFFATIMRDKIAELDSECRRWHQKMKEYAFLDVQEIPSRPSSFSEHDIFSIKSNDDTTADVMSDDELSEHLKTIDTMLSRTEKRPEQPPTDATPPKVEPPTPVKSTGESNWISHLAVATITIGGVVLLSRFVLKQWIQ